VPVTPFHFGVGMLGKGLVPRRVSLTAFLVSQFVIDLEVAYYMLLRHEYPFHRWAHTFLVGGAMGVLVGIGVVVGGRVLRAFGGRGWRVPDLREASGAPAVAGGLLGALTHPVLDGVMHDDIAPLRPFSMANPFHEAVSITLLHLGLVATALVGGVLLAFAARKLLQRARGASG
jgi:membrane-bound metal-dependent hydrolase YbcI (DUF457 family)